MMGRRVASSLVLMPVAGAAIWFGSPWIVLAVAVAAALMGWEWGRLTGRSRGPADGALMVGVACVPVALAGFVSVELGLVAAAVLILGQQFLARRGAGRPAWTIGGLCWIVLPCIAFDWMRGLTPAGDGADGFALIALIVTVVWSVDIAAFLSGRTIGGPKLAPALSPNKTWAGLIGGVAAAMAASWVLTRFIAFQSPIAVVLGSGGLAVVEQMGDMAESYAKRRFGVKDSGGLIPGHGGMLDRLDGMLAVVAAMFLIVVSR